MKTVERLLFILDKTPYKMLLLYAGIYVGVIFLLGSAIIYRYQSSINQLMKNIVDVNELREESRIILQKANQVRMQQEAVNTMLAQDPNFKIGDYFNKLVVRLSLVDKKSLEETTQSDLDDAYREVELTARFVDMNMKQVTELLQDIEQTKRVYIKRLDIQQSKKNGFLEIEIVIATLLPRG